MLEPSILLCPVNEREDIENALDWKIMTYSKLPTFNKIFMCHKQIQLNYDLLHFFRLPLFSLEASYRTISYVIMFWAGLDR